MSEEAERISPGSNGLIFLPYMRGEVPIWDTRARGFSLDYPTIRQGDI